MPWDVKNDLTGREFTRLRVLRRDPGKFAHVKWVCICDPKLGGCGTEKSVTGKLLTIGRTVSCGCLRRERLDSQQTHGHSRRGRTSKEYTSWAGMMDRCYRRESKHFDLYGGRGITVCDRWRYSFENFLADMGLKPTPKHSIDRFPNNDGNYEPGNCRWATQTQQCRNKRTNRMVTYRGETKGASDWQDETGVDAKTIIARLNYGFDAETAVTCGRYGMRGQEKYEHNSELKTLAEWSACLSIPIDTLNKRIRNGWPLESVFAPCVPGKHAPSPIRAAKRRDKISNEGHDIAALRLNPPMIEAMAMLSASHRQTAEHNGDGRVGGMVAVALVRRNLAVFVPQTDDKRTVALTDLGADLVATLVKLESAPPNIHRSLRKNMGAPMSERLRVHAADGDRSGRAGGGEENDACG